MLDLFIPSYTIKDPEAKAKARAEVCAGPMQAKLAKLSELLVRSLLVCVLAHCLYAGPMQAKLAKLPELLEM
eukprot:scaffold230249_cov26-Tisochrysis_lutea.AAC.1